MIGVITELRESERHTKWRSLGYILNKDLLVNSENKTWHQVNWSIVLNNKYNVVIFELGACYQTTKKLIYACLQHKQCIILHQGSTYRLDTVDDLNNNQYNINNSEKVDRKDNLLDNIFDEAIEIYRAKEEYKLQQTQLTELGVDDPDVTLVTKYAPLYQIEVDYTNPLDVKYAYAAITYYISNQILPDLDTLRRTVSRYYLNQDDIPDDPTELLNLYETVTSLRTDLMPEFPEYIETYGDPTYLEDVIYKFNSELELQYN